MCSSGLLLTSSPHLGRTYRYLNEALKPPAWAFGYGLGYYNVSYTSLDVSTGADGGIRASVVVATPSGASQQDEVVQLYVTLAIPEADRWVGQRSIPRRELKAFTRVSLHPGDPLTVSLEVPRERLRLVDTDGQFF